MSLKESICKCSKIRVAMMLTFIILSIFTCANSFGATQLSQFGITWTFNANYQTGQFANGDYWVVGPVTIIGINPASTSGGRTMNGSMINPSPNYRWTQGYDSAMYGGMGPHYDANLNVALNVSASNPLTVQPGSSLVSSISLAGAGLKPQLKTSAILTVLAAAAPEGSFRPPYCTNDKTIKFNKSQLNYSLLGNLTPVASTPSIGSVAYRFERPWIDHVPTWMAGYASSDDNMDDYGREISTTAGIGAIMLHLNFSNAQKETLLIRYVQLGIDNYGVIQDGGVGNWTGDGGHASGRKWPILFAGLMLGDGDMMNIGRRDIPNYGDHHPEYVHFGEDDQTFYVTPEDVARGTYLSSEIGLPEWGGRHATLPQQDKRVWTADNYRICCTANTWAGALLSAYVMGVKDLWNSDALFDYQDRYMAIETGWTRQFSGFLGDMWDTYRPNYGPVWPDTTPPETDNTPPLPPTGFTATNITSTSISLSWTASQQASDGDLASGYRVYRDGQSLGNVYTTNYTDSGLTPETAYDYSVFSYDNANNSSNSAVEGTFTTTTGDGGTTDPPIPPTSGTVYYVSPNGNDGNSGTTWSQAYRNLPSTLQRDALYYFAGGTYPDYTFDDPASGSVYTTLKKATLSDHGVETGWNSAFANNQAVFGEMRFSGASYVYFEGISPEQTVFRWNNGAASGGGVLSFSNSNHITVANCDIDGYFQGTSTSQTDGSCNVVSLQSSSYVTIDGCLIHDAADDGMEIFNSSNLKIINNEIYNLHGCGTDGGCGPCYNGHSDGIEVFDVSDSEFVGNFIHGVPSTSAFYFGGWASSTSEYCRNLLIANNIIYNNLDTGFLAYIQLTDNIKLYNNTFWGRTGGAYGGLSIGNNVTNMEMYNNIILSINYSHMGASYNASQHRGDYNFFGASIGEYEENANDIVGTDPGFVAVNGSSGPLISNISRDDFMLNQSSPCIDSGMNIDLAFDITEKARPIGTAFDRGAFEYGVEGPDITGPEVASITFGEMYIDVTFDDAVEEESATNIANYNINNNITINTATLNQQNNTVTLDTSAHSETTNYVLTINYVADLEGNVMAEAAFNYSFTNDPVGHWQFNETSGTISQDLSPSDNPANLINGATMNGTGQVLFDGIDDTVEVSMQNMNASAGTIALKFTPTSYSSQTDWSNFIFGHFGGNISDRIQIYLKQGVLMIGLGDTHALNTNIDTLQVNQEYNVALTWNAGAYRVYVDGIEKAAGTYNGLNSINTTADIGNNGNPDWRNEPFEGMVDEVRLYNRQLTVAEINDLILNKKSDIVGYWQFNEADGSTSQDLSPSGNPANLINGATLNGTGQVVFNGIDDAVEVSMQNMNASTGTIALKFTPTSYSSEADWSNFIFGHFGGNFSDRIQIYLKQGVLMIGLGNTHALNTNVDTLLVDQQYHVALTWNAGAYKAYVDGVEKAAGTFTGLNTIDTSADVGNNGNPSSRNEPFEGMVDEVRLYNRQLTDEDVADLALGKSYGYEMLNLIMANWLGYHPDADIAPPGGDGIINLLDFIELSNHWDQETSQ